MVLEQLHPKNDLSLFVADLAKTDAQSPLLGTLTGTLIGAGYGLKHSLRGMLEGLLIGYLCSEDTLKCAAQTIPYLMAFEGSQLAGRYLAKTVAVYRSEGVFRKPHPEDFNRGECSEHHG